MALPRPSRGTVLRIAGYTAFFSVCFVLAAYMTFPYDRLRDMLVQRVQAQATPGAPAPKLTIEDIGPHWLTGVSLSGVVYERPGAISSDPPTRIAIDELEVSASPFALLTQSIALDVAASVGDGELEGEYETQEGGPTAVNLELDELDLEKMGLGSALGLPLKGLASGTIEIVLAAKAAETQGQIQLQIAGAQIGDGKSKVKVPGMPGGLTLDPVDAGTITLSVTIKDGVATLEKLDGKGKELELSGSGSIRLSQPYALSRTDITLSVKLDKSYGQRSDKAKAIVEIMSNPPDPTLRRATAADGTVRLRLTGPLTALRSAPASPSGSRSTRARRSGSSAAKEAPKAEEPEDE